MCTQAAVYCTPGRAKKVVAGLTLLSLITQIIRLATGSHFNPDNTSTFSAIVFLVLPLAVLVINVIVLCEMRRAANTAATMLGHHPSTSSNSTVPTVMLIATSLVYVVLCGTWSAVHILRLSLPRSSLEMLYITDSVYYDLALVQHLVFVYNFFVYLMTGKQFRSELRTVFHCCVPAVAASATDATNAAANAATATAATSALRPMPPGIPLRELPGIPAGNSGHNNSREFPGMIEIPARITGNS